MATETPDPIVVQKKAPVGMPDTVKIILEESEHIPPTGLFLGHNGASFVIQPGVPVSVPKEIITILDDAVMSSPITEPGTQNVIGYRDRMKYPYRLAK
jgi:hypothetical protein